MLPNKNNMHPSKRPSGEDRGIQTTEEFTHLVLCDFKVKEAALLQQYNDRYIHLQVLRDRQIEEYTLLNSIVEANSMLLKKQPDTTALMQLENQLAALSYDNISGSFTLRDWQTQFGDKLFIPLLSDLLLYFINQFEVKERLTHVQIMQMACKLLSSEPMLRVKELLFVLHRSISGHYGQVYNRIGLDMVLGWLRKFYHESADHLEGRMQNMRQHETRGLQPWVEQEKQLQRYKSEQLEKKRINERVWGIQKQIDDKEQKLRDYKNQLLNNNTTHEQ